MWLVVIVFVGAFALLPWFVLVVANKGALLVPPEIMDDSLYYFARVEEVIDGQIFIGNPYYREHAAEMAPAFFGADWIAAIPRLLGFSLLATIWINVALWSMLFGALALWLGRLLGITGWRQIAFLVSVLLPSYWLLERPVAMQVVYPCFLLFLIAYLAWLSKPQEKMRIASLAGCIALSFYVYTYFWQITLVILALSHLLAVRNRTYLTILAVDAVSFLFALPMIVYTYQQLQHPWYWETVGRIGFIETHTFGSAALVSAVLITLVCAVVWLFREGISSPVRVFFITTSVALLGTTFSNVITGKDLETAVHIARFVELWVAIGFAFVLLCVDWRTVRNQYGLAVITGLVVSVCLVYGWFGLGFLKIWHAVDETALGSQKYAPVLDWLRDHTPPGSVVMANDRISYLIPATTENYVLFHLHGGLYLMPDREVVERYLASRVFANLGLADIKNDYRLFAGAGNAVHSYKTHNREVALCKFLRRDGCGEPAPDAVSYKGELYFEEIFAQYDRIHQDPSAILQKFNVSYIVIDNTTEDWHPEALSGARLAVDLGQFKVYQVVYAN